MKKRIVYYLAILALGLAAFLEVRYRIDMNYGVGTDDRALELFAKNFRGAVGKSMKEKDLVKSLTSPKLREFVKKAKAASPHSRVDSSLSATATIKDTTPAKIASPEVVCDDYDRFCFELLANGNKIVTRNQKFGFEAVIIESASGNVRVADVEFKEYKPGTDEMIPSTGLVLDYRLGFAKAPAPLPPIFHPRLVASIDSRGAIGVGAELLNFERTKKPFVEKLTLGVGGSWDRKASTLGVDLQLGYRPFNSNVTIGPKVGINSRGEIVTTPVGVSIQLTR